MFQFFVNNFFTIDKKSGELKLSIVFLQAVAKIVTKVLKSNERFVFISVENKKVSLIYKVFVLKLLNPRIELLLFSLGFDFLYINGLSFIYK